jgi:transposase
MPKSTKNKHAFTARAPKKGYKADLDVVYRRCCGVDVHKDAITACCLAADGCMEVREFSTMTGGLVNFCEWMKEEQVAMVAMESTASYWKPVFNLLEAEGIPAMLVNAQHVKNVPGRKTDVNDSEWLAMLLRVGLLNPSFVPSRDHRELRELIRYRKSIVEERSREYCRMDKVLQGANIKLSSVASSLETKSGRAMIKAIALGERDEAVLAALAKGTMRSKRAALECALRGFIQPHQRLILTSMLAHVESIDKQLEVLDAEINRRLADRKDLVESFSEVPGVGTISAQTVIAEVGTSMNQFPDVKHLVSWAGLCPANNESAGRKKQGKKRKGNQTLRTALVQCARAAAKTRDTYLNSMYARISARRGTNVAAVAVARTILEIYYHMVKNNTGYKELGAAYYEERNREHIQKRSVKRLEDLGFKVTLEVAS